MNRHARRSAVTMAEVLVVVAIVFLMLAMLIPGLSAARETARRVICQSNLRQWHFAWQAYQDDNNGYLPTEGTHGSGIVKPNTWSNALPVYLQLPAYKDLPGANINIQEHPDMHVWICPSKNRTEAYKSTSGKNQFHYAMNQVLDGLGKAPKGSRDAPGYVDLKNKHISAGLYARKPRTVLMFDIVWNSPAGTPRDVANQYQRSFSGAHIGKFHGDYANILYATGEVGHCTADNLVRNRDFRHGDVVWDYPNLYWGYPPPGRKLDLASGAGR